MNAIQSIGSSVIMGRANTVPAVPNGGGVEPRQLLNNVSLSKSVGAEEAIVFVRIASVSNSV